MGFSPAVWQQRALFLIRVFFAVAPETVKIRIEPEELRPGMEATIICDSSSSNPPAKLSWWKDGISIEGTLLTQIGTLPMDLAAPCCQNGSCCCPQSQSLPLPESMCSILAFFILRRFHDNIRFGCQPEPESGTEHIRTGCACPVQVKITPKILLHLLFVFDCRH